MLPPGPVQQVGIAALVLALLSLFEKICVLQN